MSEERFVALVTGGQPAAPGYFAYDAVLNRKARELLDHARPRPRRSTPTSSSAARPTAPS